MGWISQLFSRRRRYDELSQSIREHLDEKIADLVHKHFDLRPKGIVQMLDLLRPIYRKTAAYGHFGRDEPEFTWERTDKAAILRADAGL